MINFQYARASDVADAVRRIEGDPTAKFIAGGTNLIDLMKEDVERPSRLIDISRLPLKSVEETADGGLRIGALVPNSDLAYHPLVAQRYPMLASAILAGASQQLRNMASTGGNLAHRVGDVGGPGVLEIDHDCPIACWIAATMLGYAPQRQRLPLMSSRISSALFALPSAIRPAAEQI